MRHLMILLSTALATTMLLISPSSAQSDTAVRVVVLDETNRPVAGLNVMIRSESGDEYVVQTDTHGITEFTRLEGSACTIVEARMANGSNLSIDGTMLDGSLRLGLVAGRGRTVLLRLDQDTLLVDGETLFAGGAVPPSAATIVAQASFATPDPIPARPISEGDSIASAPALPAGGSLPAPQGSGRWPVALLMLLLLALPCGVLGLRSLLRARATGRG